MQRSQPGILEPALFPVAPSSGLLGFTAKCFSFLRTTASLQVSNSLISGLPKSKTQQVQIFSGQQDPLTLGIVSPEELSKDMGQNTRDTISVKMQVRFKRSEEIYCGAGRLLLQARDLVARLEQRKENFPSSLLKSESM